MSGIFSEQVNEVVDTMTQDSEGVWSIPEGTHASEEVRFAATLEKRRRDTQAAYTRSQDQLRRTQAERDKYAQGWEMDFSVSLSADQVEELNHLKITDPDQWRERLDELEKDQIMLLNDKKQKIAEDSEVEYRKQLMADWRKANPGVDLNDDVLANDIPPRISNELRDGKVTFEQFLENCISFLSKSSTTHVPTDRAPDILNIGDSAGGSSPSGDATIHIETSYKDIIF